jgi:uncharacterized membrane protein YjjP (DUF1212 family)
LLKEEYLERIKFVVQYGKGLHSVGAPAHSIESTLVALSDRLGMKGSFVSLPTAIFCSFRFLDEDVSRIVRIEPSGINLGLLSQVDQIGQEVINETMSFRDGWEKLEAIFESPDPFASWIRIVCFTLTSAGILTLFGGSWGDLLASASTGAIIGVLSLPKHIGVVSQLHEALMAMVATILASLFGKISGDINISVVILASLIMFIPGLNITISIAEIASQNLTSGTSRLMGGFMILLKLAFGVFAGTKIAALFSINGLDYTFARIPYWVIFISVPITSLMSTVIFKAQLKDAKWITLAGIYGYTVSKFGTFYFGPEMGLFVGGLGVGVAANLFARFQLRPSSIFQFPGLILLVPGSVGYRGLSYLYAKDIVLGFDTAFTMLALAFSLVVGVFVGNLLVKPRSHY